MSSTFDLTYYSMRERTRPSERESPVTGVDDEAVEAQPVGRTGRSA